MDHGEGPHLQREERDVALAGARVENGHRERPGGAGSDGHRSRDPQPLPQQRYGDRSGDAPAAPARTARRSAGDGRERAFIRSASIGRQPRDGAAAAPPGVIRMAALWRPILLAPTRSTLCSGSASSPRAIVIVAINVALIYACAATAASAGAEPRQISGGRRTQFRVGALLTVFAAAIFVLGIIYTDKAREVPTTGPAGLAWPARSRCGSK